MSIDTERIMNQARARQFRKEDQEDLAQETWLRSITVGQQNEPKYMTGVMKNTLIKGLIKKKIAERNMPGLMFSMYSNDNSLKDAHLKLDIIKCYKQLNPKQRAIVDTIANDPEGEVQEWADVLGFERRTLAYHLLNIRHIFKALLNRNELPGKSLGYLQDTKYDEVKRG